MTALDRGPRESIGVDGLAVSTTIVDLADDALGERLGDLARRDLGSRRALAAATIVGDDEREIESGEIVATLVVDAPTLSLDDALAEALARLDAYLGEAGLVDREIETLGVVGPASRSPRAIVYLVVVDRRRSIARRLARDAERGDRLAEIAIEISGGEIGPAISALAEAGDSLVAREARERLAAARARERGRGRLVDLVALGLASVAVVALAATGSPIGPPPASVETPRLGVVADLDLGRETRPRGVSLVEAVVAETTESGEIERGRASLDDRR